MDRIRQIDELLESFHAIRHRLMTDSDIFSAGSKISYSQWMTLRIILQKEGISVKDLAYELNITSSAATQLVDTLVKKGYLIREGSPDDRRVLKLRLSDKIREFVKNVQSQRLGKVYTLFDVVTDEELVTYCQLSKKIANKILGK
jgi:DNA-binding MarR family transcriptional regulator